MSLSRVQNDLLSCVQLVFVSCVWPSGSLLEWGGSGQTREVRRLGGGRGWVSKGADSLSRERGKGSWPASPAAVG